MNTLILSLALSSPSADTEFIVVNRCNEQSTFSVVNQCEHEHAVPLHSLKKSSSPIVSVACSSWWASGTAISGAPKGKTYVITNKHVAESWKGGDKVMDLEENEYPCRIVAKSEICDLALLLVDEELATTTLAQSAKIGETVYLQGNGIRADGISSKRSGIVRSIGADIKVDLASSPGDSGSGYLNASGQLVGVLWGGDGWTTSTGVYVSEVRKLVQSVDTKSKLFTEPIAALPPKVELPDPRTLPYGGWEKGTVEKSDGVWIKPNGERVVVPIIYPNGEPVPKRVYSRAPAFDPIDMIGKQNLGPASWDMIRSAGGPNPNKK